MHEKVIRVNNLSKRYRIGFQDEKHDTLFGKLGGILKSPIQNFRRLRSMSRFTDNDKHVHWALRDISFDVPRGEVLGIIGHNGAGKSTLLKILSRITPPSLGEVEITGRVSSLLEVGTGFHPELTGRDNVFMNGTIHGMKRIEIRSKLDEIIQFSGVEKYIDTPVKFYSSGMKVRLGFAVAAHLEPDILVIDEVLAVGDAAFQKKCLGKMQDVAQHGRTVLFVSHDMNSVMNLCSSALLLKAGKIDFSGPTQDVVDRYLENLKSDPVTLGNNEIAIREIQLNGVRISRVSNIRCGEQFLLRTVIDAKKVLVSPHLKFTIRNEGGFPLTVLSNIYTGNDFGDTGLSSLALDCIIDKTPFAPGTYRVDIEFRNNLKTELRISDAFTFDVLDADYYSSGKMMKTKAKGVMLEHNWKLVPLVE